MSNSTGDPNAALALYTTIHNLMVPKYTYLVAATVLVWDILLTFDTEVLRIWRASKSTGKNLFILNRYLVPILFAFDLVYQLHPIPSIEFCRAGFLPSSIFGVIALATTQLVLILRIYALYQNLYLLAGLTFLCMGSCGTMMATTTTLFRFHIQFLPAGTIPLVPGCLLFCEAPICRIMLTAFWIPFFVLETLIFVLTVYKSYSHLTFGRAWNRADLLTVFYRDGLIYYVVIMSISVTNLVVWVAAPITLVYVATSLMRSLQVTICSRLLLNLRDVATPRIETFQISTLKFNQPPNPPKPSASVDRTLLGRDEEDGSYAR